MTRVQASGGRLLPQGRSWHQRPADQLRKQDFTPNPRLPGPALRYERGDMTRDSNSNESQGRGSKAIVFGAVLGAGLGVSLGAVVGVVMGDVAMGVALGVALGPAVGVAVGVALGSAVALAARHK